MNTNIYVYVYSYIIYMCMYRYLSMVVLKYPTLPRSIRALQKKKKRTTGMYQFGWREVCRKAAMMYPSLPLYTLGTR